MEERLKEGSVSLNLGVKTVSCEQRREDTPLSQLLSRKSDWSHESERGVGWLEFQEITKGPGGVVIKAEV